MTPEDIDKLNADHATLKLFNLLIKLKIAGLQRRDIPMAHMLAMGNPRNLPIPKKAIRLAIVGLTVPYLIGVAFRDCDPIYKDQLVKGRL